MGILELLLLVLIIAALFGRGYLAPGLIFDILIVLLVLALIIRLYYAVF